MLITLSKQQNSSFFSVEIYVDKFAFLFFNL